MAGQMHRRVPATRDSQAIHLDLLNNTTAIYRNRRQTMAALGANYALTSSSINQRHNLNASSFQIPRCARHITDITKYSDARTRGNTPAIDISTHSPRHHHTRAVVIGKGDRALQSTSTQHRPFGNNTPKTRLQTSTIHTLKRTKRTLIIGASHGRAGHNTDIGHFLQSGLNTGNPFHGRQTINILDLGQQPSAQRVIFLRQNHVSPSLTSHKRRHQPSRPSTNHQHITKRKRLLICLWISLPRQTTKPRRAANNRLINLFPKRLWPHECLVIKPSPQKRRHQIIHCHDIGFQRRPSVLRKRL